MEGLRRSAGSAALVDDLGDGQVATKMRRFFYDEGLRQFLSVEGPRLQEVELLPNRVTPSVVNETDT